ncbi:MAG: hypothetical protein ABJG47_10970 [Ekhidna sp.]
MKKLQYITVVLTIIVWIIGFFGYLGVTHTLIVIGLIIAFFVIIFIRIVREGAFL